MSKVLARIPQMDDNALSRLFQNAVVLIDDTAKAADARNVIAAIEQEWQRRLHDYRRGSIGRNRLKKEYCAQLVTKSVTTG